MSNEITIKANHLELTVTCGDKETRFTAESFEITGSSAQDVQDVIAAMISSAEPDIKE